MPLLIATDEAGYGPRLGPLVIVATAWRMPPDASPEAIHERLSQPVSIEPYGRLQIDDSKRLFVRRASKPKVAPTSTLDLLTDAAAAWATMPLPSADYCQWLAQLAPDDLAALGQQPWYTSLINPPSASTVSPLHVSETGRTPGKPPELDSQSAIVRGQLIDHWSAAELQLTGIAARVIDAATFNALLAVFPNKAELLSHLTCELALKLWRQHAAADKTWIFSDRHGGRAYYGGLLQHHCPDLAMRVLHETPRQSCYRLSSTEDSPKSPCDIEWSFTVGGDSFAPVALSSIIAKATREQLMQRFNAYFQAAATELNSAAPPLRPTAGYAVDAERFLREIESIRVHQSLSDDSLIRRR